MSLDASTICAVRSIARPTGADRARATDGDVVARMTLPDEFFSALLDSLSEGVYFVDRERRITYWSATAERLTGFRAQDVVGRRCPDNILRHVDDEGRQLCIGRCPLTDAMIDGRERDHQIYFFHARGHRVPVRVRVVPMRNSDGEITGAAEIFRDLSDQFIALRSLNHWRQEALVDPLTQIGNRRASQQVLETRITQLRNTRSTFGIALLDVDRFKSINDTYGHAVGDEVLQVVSRTLASNMRAFDFAGRWGGEEFLAIITCQNPTELAQIAERLRHLVAASGVSRGDKEITVTVSVGATMAWPEDTVESLLARTDAMLYESKDAGRNCARVDPGMPALAARAVE